MLHQSCFQKKKKKCNFYSRFVWGKKRKEEKTRSFVWKFQQNAKTAVVELWWFSGPLTKFFPLSTACKQNASHTPPLAMVHTYSILCSSLECLRPCWVGWLTSSQSSCATRRCWWQRWHVWWSSCWVCPASAKAASTCCRSWTGTAPASPSCSSPSQSAWPSPGSMVRQLSPLWVMTCSRELCVDCVNNEAITIRVSWKTAHLSKNQLFFFFFKDCWIAFVGNKFV